MSLSYFFGHFFPLLIIYQTGDWIPVRTKFVLSAMPHVTTLGTMVIILTIIYIIRYDIHS
jgi:hypothetical protein